MHVINNVLACHVMAECTGSASCGCMISYAVTKQCHLALAEGWLVNRALTGLFVQDIMICPLLAWEQDLKYGIQERRVGSA